MTVKLLLNLGTRHHLVAVDPSKHVAGSKHDFSSEVEQELVRLGHATTVKSSVKKADPVEPVMDAPKPKRGRPRKTETQTQSEET